MGLIEYGNRGGVRQERGRIVTHLGLASMKIHKPFIPLCGAYLPHYRYVRDHPVYILLKDYGKMYRVHFHPSLQGNLGLTLLDKTYLHRGN